MNNNTGKALGAASNTIHYAPWYSQVYDAEARLDLKDYYSDYEKKTMVGLFGRLNYNYRERYYAGFTLRRDASSTFGEDVRWGWFPSHRGVRAVSSNIPIWHRANWIRALPIWGIRLWSPNGGQVSRTAA